MPPEKYEQYNDNESNKQAQLLQDIKSVLETKYTNTPVKAFGKVVVVEFADTKHQVELLPAWENEDGTFLIPNSENGGKWEYCNPREEMKTIADSNSKTGKTRMIVRMVKKWTDTCTVKIKSFKIENAVVDFLNGRDCQNLQIAEIIRDFFEYFCALTTDEEIKSHLTTALNRANKALEFENEGNEEKAVAEWIKVFGDDFPSNMRFNKSLILNGTRSLSDTSHCEPLKWGYIEQAKVDIDAYIYDSTKQNKLGGINTNGRNIVKGCNIKFRATTNCRGNYTYYWQVVNTGNEAKEDNGLRGSIFQGSQIQWEHTKYMGKHWVECFVVQNNLCIARSGKFFINI